MEFVKRLLKSSIKSCISKFLQNDIELNQMVYHEGIFELTNFLLNCNEINKQISENTELELFCQEVKIGSMKIHPSWGNIIQKMEFNDAYIKLAKGSMPGGADVDTSKNDASENDVEADPCENSIFFYKTQLEKLAASQVTMQDSLSNSIAAMEQDLKGYKNVIENVEKITKEFVAVLTNVVVDYKDLQLHIGKVSYEQKKNYISVTINNVNVVLQQRSVIWLEEMECVVEPKSIKMIIPDKVKSKLVLKLDVLLMLMQYIGELTSKKEKHDPNVFSEKNEAVMALDISVPEIDLEIEEHHAKLKEVRIVKTNTSTLVKVKKITSPFLVTSSFSIRIMDNSVQINDSNDCATPFSEKVCYYADGEKKPTELGSQDQQDQYKEKQKNESSKHILIGAKKAWINWAPCFEIIKKMFFNDKDKTVASDPVDDANDDSNENVSGDEGVDLETTSIDVGDRSVLDIDFQDDDMFMESNTECLQSDQSGPNDQTVEQKTKKWIEIHLGEASFVYNETLTFHCAGTTAFIGDHFFNVESKNITWVPNRIKVCQWSNVHCAATLKLTQFVVNADKWVIDAPKTIHETLMPYLEVEGEPEMINCKFNVKIQHIVCKNALVVPASDKLDRLILGLTGNALEVFNTSDAINVVLHSAMLKIAEPEEINILLLSIVHVNYYILSNRVTVSVNTAKATLDAVHAKAFSEFAQDFAKSHEKIVISKQGNVDNNSGGSGSGSSKNMSFQLVKNYTDQTKNTDQHHQQFDNDTTPVQVKVNSWCIRLKNHQKWDKKNYVALKGESFEVYLHEAKRIEIRLPTFEIIDGINTSNWYKAMYTNGLRILCIDDYLSIDVPQDIVLNIDQNFLTFLTQYFDWDTTGDDTTTNSPQRLPGHHQNVIEPPMTPPFSSIHISEMTFRLDYKPKQGQDFLEFVNFAALRNAKIVFREFYMFNISTLNELAQKLMINLITNMRNVQGLIAGMKPIKPIAKILANAQNIVVLPINTKLDKDYISKISEQMKKLTTNTTIEVLEIGCGINVSLKNAPSIYSNQPRTVSEGLSQAKDEFKEGMDTVFAFVRNSEDVDLLTLPIAIVRPFTSSFSRLLMGMANHLDPERKKRMDAKYKTI